MYLVACTHVHVRSHMCAVQCLTNLFAIGIFVCCRFCLFACMIFFFEFTRVYSNLFICYAVLVGLCAHFVVDTFNVGHFFASCR